MDDLFTIIKRGKVPGGFEFGCTWDELQDGGFAQDFRNVYKEYLRTGKVKYDHPENTTDDTVHSLVYSFIVSQFIYPRRDLNI
jgi:hypothetical protein